MGTPIRLSLIRRHSFHGWGSPIGDRFCLSVHSVRLGGDKWVLVFCMGCRLPW